MPSDLTSPFRIRGAAAADLPAVRRLNEAALPAVNSVPLSFFEQRLISEPYFRVAEVDGELAGLLLVMDETSSYESMNFTWFSERYDRFAYVDRIVVSDSTRGLGIGRALYEDLIAVMTGKTPRVTCEVNTRPRNEASLAFHARMGFKPVGTQDTEGGSKTVQLMTLALP